jgi:hypothetical protein
MSGRGRGRALGAVRGLRIAFANRADSGDTVNTGVRWGHPHPYV